MSTFDLLRQSLQTKHIPFPEQSMLTVCTARLRDLRSSTLPEESRPNPAVEAEIKNLLSGKSLDQLVQLENSVRAKLGSGEPVDTDYWEGLLKSLEVWKARVRFFFLSLSLSLCLMD